MNIIIQRHLCIQGWTLFHPHDQINCGVMVEKQDGSIDILVILVIID